MGDVLKKWRTSLSRASFTSTASTATDASTVPPATSSSVDEKQREHLRASIEKAKALGRSAVQCKKCQKKRAYMYRSFEHRGGTKSLYACEVCFFSWSDFQCNEEDYDFLSQ